MLIEKPPLNVRQRRVSRRDAFPATPNTSGAVLTPRQGHLSKGWGDGIESSADPNGGCGDASGTVVIMQDHLPKGWGDGSGAVLTPNGDAVTLPRTLR